MISESLEGTLGTMLEVVGGGDERRPYLTAATRTLGPTVALKGQTLRLALMSSFAGWAASCATAPAASAKVAVKMVESILKFWWRGYGL